MHSRTDATEWYGIKKVEQEEAELVSQPENWCVAERQNNQQEKHYEWDYELRLLFFIGISTWTYIIKTNLK